MNNNGGYTLVELLAVVAIVGILVTGILPTITTANRWVNESNTKTCLINYSIAVLEEVKAHPENVTLGTFTDSDWSSLGVTLTPDNKYVCTIRITNYNNNEHLFEITVRTALKNNSNIYYEIFSVIGNR